MQTARMTLLRLAVVCFAALVTLLIGRQVQAAWVWYHKWAYSTFIIDNSIAGYMGSYMNNAGSDYSNNTRLDWTGSNGLIRGYTANFGAFAGYNGYTYPSNAMGQNCYYYPTPSSTGNCNTTTNKATSAIIYYNDYYLNGFGQRDWLARHEMGHVFGLYHPPCSDPYTVMYDTGCGQFPSTLQADEKNWINANY